MLTPKWEKVANELKNTVKVAYWDTETNGPAPPLLGQIKGTPTIKAFVPSRKSARNDIGNMKTYIESDYVSPAEEGAPGPGG